MVIKYCKACKMDVRYPHKLQECRDNMDKCEGCTQKDTQIAELKERVSELEGELDKIIDEMFQNDSSTIPPSLKRVIFVASKALQKG